MGGQSICGRKACLLCVNIGNYSLQGRVWSNRSGSFAASYVDKKGGDQ